jgi:hypothetical protein
MPRADSRNADIQNGRKLMRSSSGKMLLGAAVMCIAMSLSACGKQSSDTVDNSEITDMNAVGTMEGTTNDMSAMDSATDTNVAMDNMAMDNMANGSGDATADNGSAGNSM